MEGRPLEDEPPQIKKRCKDPPRISLCYPCDECEFSSATKSDLKRHMNSEHINNSYSCSNCSFVTSSKKGLRGHFTRAHIMNVKQFEEKALKLEEANERKRELERLESRNSVEQSKPRVFLVPSGPVVAGNDSTDFTDGRARSRCCSVPGCKNRNGQMHTFPKNNPQRVQRWLQAINVDISSYKINSYRRVCHLHFPPESYARNLQAELLNYPCRKRLAEDAVPSLLLPPPPAEGINPPVPKLKLVEDMICQQPDSSGSKRYACCIPKCSNRNGTMHSFPSDQDLRAEWMKAIGLSRLVSPHIKVCGKHFSPDSYVRNLQAELLNYQPYRKLLSEQAVPSLFLSTSTPESTIIKQESEDGLELVNVRIEDGIKQESKDGLELVNVRIEDGIKQENEDVLDYVRVKSEDGIKQETDPLAGY